MSLQREPAGFSRCEREKKYRIRLVLPKAERFTAMEAR